MCKPFESLDILLQFFLDFLVRFPLQLVDEQSHKRLDTQLELLRPHQSRVAFLEEK
jgi:hypothetical protein